MGAHVLEPSDELKRELRLVGPDGDPDSQQLWLALWPCIVLGHALLRAVETVLFLGPQHSTASATVEMVRNAAEKNAKDTALELHARLSFAVNHTPLAEKGRRQPAMKSRDRWLADGWTPPSVPPRPDDAMGRAYVEEETAENKAAYRRYSLTIRTTEVRAASDTASLLIQLVRFAGKMRLDEDGQTLMRQLVRALEAAKPAIESYARIVRRMETMERLGGGTRS